MANQYALQSLNIAAYREKVRSHRYDPVAFMTQFGFAVQEAEKAMVVLDVIRGEAVNMGSLDELKSYLLRVYKSYPAGALVSYIAGACEGRGAENAEALIPQVCRSLYAHTDNFPALLKEVAGEL